MYIQQFNQILNLSQLESILANQVVKEQLAKLTSFNLKQVYFFLNLSDDVRTVLFETMGLKLPINVPMRWIQGDTPAHIDTGFSKFDNTYLVYVTSSEGNLIIENNNYPILAGNGYVFNENLNHSTINTEGPRLIIGPMAESGIPVGGPPVYYYSNKASADAAGIDYIGTSDYTLIEVSGYTVWIISDVSSSGSDRGTYDIGSTLTGDGIYYLYPAGAICFNEGSEILTDRGYQAVENLRPGNMVLTLNHGYMPIKLMGKSSINNSGNTDRIQNRMYKLPKENYPDLKNDLYLTGCHSILVDNLTDEQREKIVKDMGKIYLTDSKYRLMAYVDERAQPCSKQGTFTIYHFSLGDNLLQNYGIYANGLLVETSFGKHLLTKPNIKLIR